MTDSSNTGAISEPVKTTAEEFEWQYAVKWYRSVDDQHTTGIWPIKCHCRRDACLGFFMGQEVIWFFQGADVHISVPLSDSHEGRPVRSSGKEYEMMINTDWRWKD